MNLLLFARTTTKVLHIFQTLENFFILSFCRSSAFAVTHTQNESLEFGVGTNKDLVVWRCFLFILFVC